MPQKTINPSAKSQQAYRQQNYSAQNLQQQSQQRSAPVPQYTQTQQISQLQYSQQQYQQYQQQTQQQAEQQSPSQEQKTSIWAILSLIFAFLMPLLGIIFGIVALVKISKNPYEKGKGLAIAGIVISCLLVILLPIIAAFAFFGALSVDKFIPEGCRLPAGTSCTDYKITQTQIIVSLQNRLGYDITGVKLNAENCGTSNQINIPNDQKTLLTIQCNPPLKGDKYTGVLTLTYTNPETGLQLQKVGNLIGKI